MLVVVWEPPRWSVVVVITTWKSPLRLTTSLGKHGFVITLAGTWMVALTTPAACAGATPRTIDRAPSSKAATIPSRIAGVLALLASLAIWVPFIRLPRAARCVPGGVAGKPRY